VYFATNFDEIRKDKDFKKHFPNYDKSKNNFNDLKDRISTACQNAKNNQHTNYSQAHQILTTTLNSVALITLFCLSPLGLAR
jgi:hypothetical protein